MEGTIGEIRIYAANFAPKYWAFCQGQTLAIQQNQALFSILGTVYGGNGVQTFQLPDLRGRVPVGTGNGIQGAPNIVLGQIGGENTHTLIINELPVHTHTATFTGSLSVAPPAFVLNASSTPPDNPDPNNNLLADETSSGLSVYADGTNAVVAMASNTITGAFSTNGSPTVNLQLAGGSSPHTNMQPYLVMNYVICLLGLYPSRN